METESSLQNFGLKGDRAIDNFQNCDSYINVQSSQNYTVH
jgi:hypothetical protein